MGRWIRRGIGLVVLVLVVGAAVYALVPNPLPVDLETVERGELHVTIDEDGVARIGEVFRVSAPVAGKLARPPVSVGDRVVKNTTTVATITPVDPPFLDARSRREIEAAVGAARAAVGLAEAQLRGAQATERMVQSDLERAQRLATAGTISKAALEKAITDLDTAAAQVEQARATLELRKSELLSAEARLIEPDQPESASNRDACCLAVRAPVDGVVLDVLAESEQVVAAGTPLLEIGDPVDMEVIVHLLSTDAVQIGEGASATLTDWGRDGELSARVKRIDPAGYTKISALGIEEQRVDAELEILDEPERWRGLGHEFRVMVHIALWEGADVVKAPMGALFRHGDDWQVFRVVDGRAVATSVDIGQRNSDYAQVVEGLSAGDVVILHPSDSVVDGTRVVSRDEAG